MEVIMENPRITAELAPREKDIVWEANEFADKHGEATERLLRYYIERDSNKDDKLILFREGDKLAGVAYVTPPEEYVPIPADIPKLKEKHLEIDTLVLRTDLKNKKIGKHVMKYLLGFIRKNYKGYEFVECFIVPGLFPKDEEDRFRKIISDLGFEKVGIYIEEEDEEPCEYWAYDL